jgi:hypothetical protein
VDPLHLGVAGAVVVEDVDRGGRVGKEAGAAALGDVGEDVGCANDGEGLELGNGEAAKGDGDRQGEEEAVAPTAEAGCGGAVFSCVGGDPEEAAKVGKVGEGSREGWGVRCREVTSRSGTEGLDPSEGAGDAHVREFDRELGVGRKARRGVAAGLVKAVHGDAAPMDGSGDVLEQAEKFTVVAEEDWFAFRDEAEFGDGAEGFSVGYNDGAVEAIEQEANPEHAAAGLALGRACHDDANVGSQLSPMAEDQEGAGDADGGEVGIVGIAARRDQAVLTGAEGGAFGEVGLVGRVGVSCTEGCFVGVDSLSKDPEDGVGKPLGDVGRWGKAESENVLGDPRRNVGAFLVGDPKEGGLVPFAGVGRKLVEEVLKVVGELEHGEIEHAAGVEKDGHVVGQVGKVGLDFGEPLGLTGCRVKRQDGWDCFLPGAAAVFGSTELEGVRLWGGALAEAAEREHGGAFG